MEATRLDPQNDWSEWQSGVNYDLFAQVILSSLQPQGAKPERAITTCSFVWAWLTGWPWHWFVPCMHTNTKVHSHFLNIFPLFLSTVMPVWITKLLLLLVLLNANGGLSQPAAKSHPEVILHSEPESKLQYRPTFCEYQTILSVSRCWCKCFLFFV